MIHDHLRHNMQVLAKLIDRAASGEASVEDVARETAGLDMVANYRRFGSLCGQYCLFVEAHHGIEDEAVFPRLAERSPVMKAIADRLRAEHVVVHALLEDLVAALNALVGEPTPENFAAARAVYETLARVLLSHLGYEEDAIGDALGHYGIGV
jgi:hemerythrin-like domain-containing protein